MRWDLTSAISASSGALSACSWLSASLEASAVPSSSASLTVAALRAAYVLVPQQPIHRSQSADRTRPRWNCALPTGLHRGTWEVCRTCKTGRHDDAEVACALATESLAIAGSGSTNSLAGSRPPLISAPAAPACAKVPHWAIAVAHGVHQDCQMTAGLCVMS